MPATNTPPALARETCAPIEARIATLHDKARAAKVEARLLRDLLTRARRGDADAVADLRARGLLPAE